MSVAPGTRIGPYEVISMLGAGGMGEVYRAYDPRLQRDVALKILPEIFASDPDRLARFQREARAVAALNHPNIAGIYGVEESNALRALALEFVDGETLADRIARGRIPLDEALPIARQIAEALEAAHEHGIIHRDLKPSNIKIAPGGVVKVLDFGLAKALDLDGTTPDSTNSPTITAAATRVGTILGTAAYMSPEQARGRPVDKRSDVWAFGCVMFECVTGKRAFDGDTVTDSLAAIVMREPDWSALPADTPDAVRTLLRRCLQKDRRNRLRDLGDAALELTQPATARPVLPVSRSARWLTFGWVFAGAFGATALGLAVLHFRELPLDQPAVKFQMYPPPDTVFGEISVSPDGRRIAFTTSAAGGKRQLWVRPLDAVSAEPQAGTEGASAPFWSVDGNWIGFFADEKLKKIAASGGPAQPLANAPNNHGGTWSAGEVILFAPNFSGPLYKVSAHGGAPALVTELDGSHGEVSHRWPQFLPDGKHFLYFILSGELERQGTYLGSLDSKQKRLVLPATSAIYANSGSGTGHLLFVREGTLLSQPFDPQTAELTGEPTRLAQPVGLDATMRVRGSVADNGVLVYDSIGIERQLAWSDRRGKALGTVGPVGSYFTLELSPDGSRVAANRTDPQTGNVDIWIFDLSRGNASRLTAHPAGDGSPVWSPDGSRIVFSSNRLGALDLYQKLASGVGDEELLLKTSVNKRASSWSRDGRFLTYTEHDPKTRSDIWVLPIGQGQAERKPLAFAHTEFNEAWGRFSPNGSWVAYQTDESGRDEIYVRAFSPTQSRQMGKWQVSTGGGVQPRWRADGRELFYLAPDLKLMAVDVRTNAEFEAGIPRPLFSTRALPGANSFYEVNSEGQRFLVNQVQDAASAPATVVVNWPAGLNK